MEKMKLDPDLMLYPQIISGHIKNLNTNKNGKTFRRLLKKNYDLKVEKDFLHKTKKSANQQEKSDKSDCLIIKNSCHQRTEKRINRQITNYKRYLQYL